MSECCVCLNICNDKTECNHTLCVKCFNKLKYKKCPLCRKDITIFDNKYIEVIKSNGFYKLIKMSNLRRFVFSKEFKTKLSSVLNNLKFNRFFVNKFIIKNYVYRFDEIIAFKDFKYSLICGSLFGNVYYINSLTHKILCNQQLTEEEMFVLNNIKFYKYFVMNSEIKHLQSVLMICDLMNKNDV